jgi:uncharacterized membrane protein AbrB (regulator of aidB expression)
MSLYSMVHAGSDTMANVMVGGLAQGIGIPIAMTLGGILALVVSGVLWLVIPSVRQLE